jgi:hypothetical protein
VIVLLLFISLVGAQNCENYWVGDNPIEHTDTQSLISLYRRLGAQTLFDQSFKRTLKMVGEELRLRHAVNLLGEDGVLALSVYEAYE